VHAGEHHELLRGRTEVRAVADDQPLLHARGGRVHHLAGVLRAPAVPLGGVRVRGDTPPVSGCSTPCC
jgi:hypothetical protein